MNESLFKTEFQANTHTRARTPTQTKGYIPQQAEKDIHKGFDEWILNAFQYVQIGRKFQQDNTWVE